jgi:hypothetical protein
MYESLGLNENPFEIAPITYQMAGRQAEWELIKRRLKVAFDGNSCKFIVILGDYGIGKTFTVNRLYQEIKNREAELRTLVVKTLAGQPIQAHPAEPSSGKFALDLITRIFANLEFERMKTIFRSVDLDSKVAGISLATRKLFLEIAKGSNSAFLVLSGEAASAKDKEIGLKTIRTSEEAKVVFREFLRVLRLANYDNLLIILDEFEYIMTQSASRITVILQTLREIFDEYSIQPERLAKVVIVFTVSPGGWERLSNLEVSQTKRTGGAGIVPFRQRIDPRDIIALSSLSPSEVEEMIAIRLTAHRLARPPTPIHPFTKGAIRVISEASNGVPRIALVYASILLDNTIEKNLKEISESDAKRILKEMNVYVETRG